MGVVMVVAEAVYGTALVSITPADAERDGGGSVG